jgi:DNA-binding beta-propeller fold protein YncE
MVQTPGDKEDKFDFNLAGDEVGQISLEQARVQAIEHARDNTDFYGPAYEGVRLVWEVVSTDDGEHYYDVKLSFRPAGRFRGEPGLEQFIFDKTGQLRIRQLLDEPAGIGERGPSPSEVVGDRPENASPRPDSSIAHNISSSPRSSPPSAPRRAVQSPTSGDSSDPSRARETSASGTPVRASEVSVRSVWENFYNPKKPWNPKILGQLAALIIVIVVTVEVSLVLMFATQESTQEPTQKPTAAPVATSSPPPSPIVFKSPVGIALHPETGEIYVADALANRLYKFTADGTWVSDWGSESSGLRSPNGLAVNLDGEVFVADTGNHRVQVYAPDGEVWGSEGAELARFNRPEGISINRLTREVYVADTGNHRVQVFTADGSWLRDWGRKGSDDGQFLLPSGITVHPDTGEVFVADTDNHRVQVFTPEGKFIAKWGVHGDLARQINRPKGIALKRFSEKVYVADTGNHRVHQFKLDGTYITTWGWEGTGNSQFMSPSGIAVQPDTGKVFVADSGNHRVKIFDEKGTFIARWGTTATTTVDRTIDRPTVEVSVLGSGNSQSASKADARKSSQSKEWYVGGTLHGKTLAEWRAATYTNRLATSADFVIKAGNFRSLPLDLKSRATELERCISNADAGIEVDHWRVSETGAACALLLGY